MFTQKEIHGFFRRERLKGGTPKRTKAAWPEKATSENATCDENVFQKRFLGENMNRIVPENVEMVCERATWKTWKGTESNFPRGSTELVLWLHAEGSNSDQFPSDQFPSFPVFQWSVNSGQFWK